MKIICNRAVLYEAVQLAASIVPPRSPKPILQCAKLQAEPKENKLTVTATDNEIMVKYVINQVQIEAEGSTVVPADRISAILHESRDETVSIETQEATCQISGADSQFHIYGHDPDDFPEISTATRQEQQYITASTLKHMIHLSTFASARENTRYAINGVLWEQKGKKLRMVATDGRRLAQVDGEMAAAQKEAEQAAVIPVKTLLLLEKILNDPEEKIYISFSENQLNVSTTAVQLASNLVQGRFPKYSDVIPKGAENKAQINTEQFRSGVRRAALLTNEMSRGVLLEFAPPDKLQLSSSTPEAGDAQVEMKVSYQGEALKIGFNPQYILEALRVIVEEEITFEFQGPSKPGLIRTGKDFLYVLMPVTV